MGSSQTLSLADVPWLIKELQPKRTIDRIDNLQLAGRPLQELEQRAILATLEETHGNQTRAAKVLGISDRTLRDKIKRYRNQEQLASTR
jgi:DNA-binding NtrC family response regulator